MESKTKRKIEAHFQDYGTSSQARLLAIVIRALKKDIIRKENEIVRDYQMGRGEKIDTKMHYLRERRSFLEIAQDLFNETTEKQIAGTSIEALRKWFDKNKPNQ